MLSKKKDIRLAASTSGQWIFSKGPNLDGVKYPAAVLCHKLGKEKLVLVDRPPILPGLEKLSQLTVIAQLVECHNQ